MMLTPVSLAAFQEGDERTIGRLVRELSPIIYRRCRRHARDDESAWDAVQETWALAWRHRRTFRGTGSLTNWLLRLSRKASRQARARDELLADPDAIDSLPALSPGDQHDALLRQDLDDDVITAVLELPGRQRSVVLHRLVLGMSTRETAELLHCAEGTVKATLSQALQTLRKWTLELNSDR